MNNVTQQTLWDIFTERNYYLGGLPNWLCALLFISPLILIVLFVWYKDSQTDTEASVK